MVEKDDIRDHFKEMVNKYGNIIGIATLVSFFVGCSTGVVLEKRDQKYMESYIQKIQETPTIQNQTEHGYIPIDSNNDGKADTVVFYDKVNGEWRLILGGCGICNNPPYQQTRPTLTTKPTQVTPDVHLYFNDVNDDGTKDAVVGVYGCDSNKNIYIFLGTADGKYVPLDKVTGEIMKKAVNNAPWVGK